MDKGSLSSTATNSTAGSETRLIRVVHTLYKRWACFIVKHSWALIILCTIATCICTVKIVLTP